MVRFAVLICIVWALVGAEPRIEGLEAPSWVTRPGATVPVAVQVRGNGGELQVRTDLVTLAGVSLWSVTQDLPAQVAACQVQVPIPAGATLGDHGLRVSLLRNGAPVDAVERALVLAQPGDLVLIFDREPIEAGIRFQRRNVQAKEVVIDGVRTWVHEMTYGSQGEGEGWWRSCLMTLADPAYREGKRPIADIEVVYQHEGDAPVELAADTAAGSRVVAKGWGRSPRWQRLSASLGDARFAAPAPTSDPKLRAAEGCDLRYNACTTDGRIRSVRIHAPDAREPADWSRFLSATDFASRHGWVVEPGQTDTVSVTYVNKALAEWRGRFRFEVCSASGKVLSVQDQDLRIAAQGRATVSAPATLPAAGEHLLRLRLLRRAGDREVQDLGWERSAMAATPDHAFVLFEEEPIARGIEVLRDRCAPKRIITNGLHRWVWTAQHGSAKQGWWRSLRMNVTDPAFQDGKAPVVDAEVRFIQRSDAPVDLSADTRRGGGAVASSWGSRGPEYERNPPVKHLLARIDDARFARTAAGEGAGENDTDGCDLRYNACTTDGEIRSLVLRRHALEGAVDWSRLLRPLGVDCGKDRYVFAPGEEFTATLRLANRARIPFTETATVRFTDDLDRPLWTRQVPLRVEAESEGTLAVPVATDGLRQGVYHLKIEAGKLVKTETFIAVSDSDPIPKAAEGDFLYGTDLGGEWNEARKLDWADFMGFDIIRNCARSPGLDRDGLDRAIAELKRRGLRGHLMIDPAYDPDPAKRAGLNAKLAEFLIWATKAHADYLHWYELGNEPDLPFFYRGSIDEYLEGYRVLHAAIRAGDPSAVIMNGGLCFHGRDGWARAHELVEKMPEDLIDAWAYHGHGPGAKAERGAWERQDQATRAVGKADRPFIETESGFSGNDAPTRRIQARTIVQKMVFAQSKDAPFFLWFNLHMGDEGWTTIERGAEPRPAVLAHRTLARHLKGLDHVAELDLKASDAECHVFRAADGRRGLVAWSDSGEITRSILVGAKARDLRRCDLFGNIETITTKTAGLVQLGIGPDPVYLLWHDASDHQTQVPPPALAGPARISVIPGRPLRIPLILRNASAGPVQATLAATLSGAAPLTDLVVPGTVAVPASGEVAVTVTAQGATVAPSSWPTGWTVFAPVTATVDLKAFTTIPDAVGTAKPQLAIPDGEGLIDLASLGGGHDEKKQAIAFAWYDSPMDGEITIGAAADWWMEWAVNGVVAYSTLESGNRGPYHVLTHTFTAPVRKGRNLLAARVLSGSGGWRLVSGGPDEVAAARRAKAGEGDALVLEARVGGDLLARETIPVHILRPVEDAPEKAAWDSLAPVGVLAGLDNLHAAQPDSAKWYKGADDLSGRIWVRRQGGTVRLIAAVRDDRAQAGDRAEATLTTADGSVRKLALRSRRDAGSGETWYEAEVPAKDLGGDRFTLSLRVHDDDWGEAKQTMVWDGFEAYVGE